MNVLIVDFDPFANTGGGQTVYRNIIRRNPSIHFSYFTRNQFALPAAPNCEPIYFRHRFIGEYHPTDSTDEAHYSAFLSARNFAFAARGRQFDVVDVPDYYDFASYLGPALREFEVRFDRLFMSLHGRLSETRFINWEAFRAGLCEPGAGQPISRQIAASLERAALRTADGRYGISDWYVRHLSKDLGQLPVERLCPWSLMEAPPATRTGEAIEQRPETLFVGRLERTKGPDTFVDLAWLTGAADYGPVTMLGADERCQGASIAQQLLEQARKRNLPLQHLPAVPRDALLERLQRPCVVIAPSRFETFGLVPLEGLLRGALAAYSRSSGLADFVRQEMPELVRAELDTQDLTNSADLIRPLLAEFSRLRARNIEYLAQLALDRKHAEQARDGFMHRIYSMPSHADEAMRDEFEYRYNSELSTRAFVSLPNKTAAARQLFRTHISPRIPNWIQASRWHLGRMRTALRQLKPRPRETARRVVAERLPALRALGAELKTRKEIAATPKPVNAYDVLKRLAESSRAGRMYHFQTLAMGEARRGNLLLRHLYLQRVARWTGTNRLYDCTRASTAYASQGFDDVATVLPWLCPASTSERDQRIQNYLQNRVHRFPLQRKDDYAIRIAHRPTLRPRVSIVVSLYNAQDKLDTFTAMLSRCDLVRARQVELIFVDSASPKLQLNSERLRQLRTWTDYLYLRTSQRETIATAWNRGLSEARGEYIVCLGADEMVTPDGLGKLAAYLDHHPEIDWVTANSIVMNVGTDGRFLNSPLVYDRSEMTELTPIVDPTYVNYVGGMYRRRIHDLYGGYDTSFRAASDTEFKHRIFPFIRSGHLNETLGVFLDYPEARMTAHPRAEAEDLRAMYLFRTLGGLRYLLKQRSESQAFELLRLALSFRRSYATTYDTDLDLAVNVATYLTETNPDSQLYDRLRKDVEFLRHVARRCDSWNGSRREYLKLSQSAWKLSRVEKAHRALFAAPVYYHLFNDVRYSVHCNVWSLKEKVF